MSLDVNALHKLIDEWVARQTIADLEKPTVESATGELIRRELPKDKRVVRTRSSGDRVYLLDETKKSRQWLYNPEVLSSLGFEMSDVTEVEDNELLKYAMGPAILKAVERDDARA